MNKKFYNIINGWKNYIFPNKEVEELAKERAKICATCPINTNNVCSRRKCREIEGKKKCGCGCPLAALLRSELSSCALGKW